MKKLLIVILVIVLTLGLAVALTACDRHQHDYGDLIAEVPASCKDGVNGVKAHYKCSECGALFDENKKEVTEADLVIVAAHTFDEWEEVYPATETTSGLKTRTCSVCGTIETQYTDLLKHEWSEWKSNSNGTHTRTCAQSDCQIGTETVACLYANGEVTAPTCNDGGYTIYTCTVCNYTLKTEEVNALGHDYGDFTPDYVGVENLDGHVHTHTRICRRCGDTDTQNCTQTIDEVIAPTCELGGYTKHTCIECGSVHEDSLTNATGHAWSEWQYDETTADTHTRTCSNNPIHVETQSCVYAVEETVQPGCEEGGYTSYACRDCKHYKKDDLTSKLEHVWGDWKYDGDDDPSDDATHTHSRLCERCKQSEQQACQISSSENVPTCESSGYTVNVCTVCFMSFSDNETKPLGHAWGKWVDSSNGKHTRTCGNNSAHVEEAEHNYSLETTPATCLNARVDTYTCVDCGNSYSNTVGEPLGHSWGAWVVTETAHSRTCLLDDSHLEQSAHSFTTTNLCVNCEYDALTYTLKGVRYVVTPGSKLAASVTTVIIRATHTAVGDNTAYEVTEIASSAFSGKSRIVAIELPETLTLIGPNAFYNCTSLKNVKFSEQSSLTTIDSSAFLGCAALESISIPASVTTIGATAFYNCVNLREIEIYDNITSLGMRAFINTAYFNSEGNWKDGVLYLGNHLLQANENVASEYVVNDGTVTIGHMAFSDCANLAKITLPKSLLYIERDAFLGCTVLEEVEYLGAMRDWFSITFVNDASSPLYYAARLHIDGAYGNIEIPDHVKAIPAGTFRGTSIESVVIPDGVTSIGEEAFQDCANLRSIVIPDSVTYVGANVFTGSAYYLDPENWVDGVLYINNHLIAANAEVVEGELTVRDGTITVGIDAFKNCARLTNVTVAQSVVRIGAGAFDGCAALTGVTFITSNSSWFVNRVNSISRLVNLSNMTAKQIAEQFTFYNGEWKLWSQSN